MSIDESKRHTETFTVQELTEQPNGWAQVLTTNSTGFITAAENAAALPAGAVFELETVNYSTITGIRVAGAWLYRKTDEDLAEEHRLMLLGFARERRSSLEKNRTAWQTRQDALPEWIRTRIEGFHASGGESFALEGWGYELVCAELAVAYLASGGEDDAAVMEISRREGTSGNQHDVAKFMARVQREKPEVLEQVPSALTPLTGDPDYSKAADAETSTS